MKTLSIDLETYSSADIGKTGVYRYSESSDFEILLFGYSIIAFRFPAMSWSVLIPETSATANPPISR